MKKLLCIVFLAILLFSNIALAEGILTLEKYVNDYAGVLSETEENGINQLCREIENNWTVEIAVLTVRTTGDMSIEEYAVEIFKKNGIGKKDVDNGLLLVAAIDDREWRFEVGYGLEGIINDAKAGRAGRTYLVPYFQEERYGEGLYYAVEAVGKIIESGGDDSFISETEIPDEYMIIFIIFTLFFIFLVPAVMILIFIGFSFQKCPSCGARMKCRYEDDYVVCTCPKCGKKTKKERKRSFWFFVAPGGGFRSGGSGSGGFGGGSSGGGGASGGW